MPVSSLANVMSTFPVRVDSETTVEAASALLDAHGFHHLPVSDGADVIGVVSSAMLDAAHAAGGSHLPLSALCGAPPVTAEIHTPVRDVAAAMREVGADAAVVVSRGRLAGIVTTSDICRVLMELIPGPPRPPGPPDVA